MRNAGIRNLYRRGKVYYYVKDGKWTSLRTRDRAEARRQLEKLREQEITAAFLKKSGLLDLLQARAGNPLAVEGSTKSRLLAPRFAKGARGDFETVIREFTAQIPSDTKTGTMWNTCSNSLINLMNTLEEFAKEDLRALDPWEKFIKLTPSGVWVALREGGAGPSSLNHFACYLRKLVPELKARSLVPAWFDLRLKAIKHQKVHARELHIPSPAEMAMLLAACEARDWGLTQLLQFLRFSGARKEAALGDERGLTYSRIHFATREIVLWQKGDKRRKVPMGPQLVELLRRWQEHTGGSGDMRVFPFGSTREDRIQKILKEVAADLGGPVRDIKFFHAFKHYFKTQHQRQGTPNEISDLLTFNEPAGRTGSGDVYRHGEYELMRQCVERVTL